MRGVLGVDVRMHKGTLYLRRAATAGLLGLGCAGSAPLYAADPTQPQISEGSAFEEQGGAQLYQAICQGCHMSEGQGAIGAGMYPALRQNPRLGSAAYPAYNVLHGRNGMPAFGKQLSDVQVADVVNYLRTHFDNHFTDAIGAADVSKLR